MLEPHTKTFPTSLDTGIIENKGKNLSTTYSKRQSLKLCGMTCCIVLVTTFAAAVGIVALEMASLRNTSLKTADVSVLQVCAIAHARSVIQILAASLALN